MYKVGDIITQNNLTYWLIIKKDKDTVSMINPSTNFMYPFLTIDYLKYYHYRTVPYNEVLVSLHLDKFPDYCIPYLQHQIEYEDVNGF